MGPISPVNTGQVSSASGLQPSQSTMPAADSGAGVARTGFSSSTALGSSQAVMNLQAAVTQLLQSAGGSVESDRLMRLLIIALILMSLLQQMEDDGGANKQQPLAQLGNGGGDRSQYVGIFTSSTTISIQQSTTTVIMGSGLDSGGAAGDAAQGTGARLDASA